MGNKKSLQDSNTKLAVAKKLLAFGQQIRMFRKAKGLSQIEFAKLLGLSVKSQTAICNIENGKRILSFSKMAEIARKLGYDIKVTYTPMEEQPASILVREDKASIPEN